MSNPDFFNNKNHKHSSRISGLATFLMGASVVCILGGIVLSLMDKMVFGSSMLGTGIIALVLRPLVDGLGILVYNAENQILKDTEENQ